MLFDVDRKEIGSAIRELRVRHNFSQKDLGRIRISGAAFLFPKLVCGLFGDV